MNTTTTVRLGSPDDLIEAVPYLLGFHPENSVVLVFFEHCRHIVTIRVDWGSAPDDLPGVLKTVRSQRPVDMVAVVAYPPAGTAGMSRLAGIAGQLEGAGLVVSHLIDATESRTVPSGAGTAACGFVAAGRRVLPDREAMVEQVAIRSAPRVAAVAAVLEPVDPSGEWGTAATRRETEDALYDHLTAPAPVAEPTAVEQARWLAALADHRLREPVLRRVVDCGGLDQATARLVKLLQGSPSTGAAALAATTAAVAWLAGNSVLAGAAADLALRENPETRLAQLVRRGVDSGTAPAVLADLLRGMRLEDLRA